MKSLLVIIFATVSIAMPAMADHDKDDFSALTSAANILNSRVYRSYLSRRVKWSVEKFYSDIKELEFCAIEEEPGELFTKSNFFDHGRDDCPRLVRDAVRNWYRVDRYLYDTNWDYPGVYDAYLEMRARVNRTLSTYPL